MLLHVISSIFLNIPYAQNISRGRRIAIEDITDKSKDLQYIFRGRRIAIENNTDNRKYKNGLSGMHRPPVRKPAGRGCRFASG